MLMWIIRKIRKSLAVLRADLGEARDIRIPFMQPLRTEQSWDAAVQTLRSERARPQTTSPAENQT